MTGRRLYAAATIVVVVGLGAAAALLWGGYPTPAGTLVAALVVTLAVGWSFAGLGLVGWRRWPASLAGPLMVAVGLAWFARALGAVQHPWSFNAGLLIGAVYLAVLAHLVVTYPSGRIITRSQRVVVAAAYLCTVPLNFVGHWLIPSSEPCRDCPYNLLIVDRPAAAPTGGHQVLYALVVTGTAAVLIVMVRRWWAATAAGRRSYAPAVGGRDGDPPRDRRPSSQRHLGRAGVGVDGVVLGGNGRSGALAAGFGRWPGQRAPGSGGGRGPGPRVGWAVAAWPDAGRAGGRASTPHHTARRCGGPTAQGPRLDVATGPA